MGTRRAHALLWLALACLVACAMERHREQVRQGFLTRGLHRDAFVKEWGPPARTFSVRSPDWAWKAGQYNARWERPVYEVWEYPDRATCLTFDGVRLRSWETGVTDCTPQPTRGEAPPPGPPPAPPYP